MRSPEIIGDKTNPSRSRRSLAATLPLKRIGSILSLGLLMIAPVAAGASQPMAIWPAVFQSLNELPGGPDATWDLRRSGALSGDSGEARQVPLPFSFRVPGSVDLFSAVNIGSKGYVTFGTHGNDSNASRTAAESLLQTVGSRNLIAAWWGNHFCDPTRGIKTKVLGSAPARAFVIEWDGCSKLVGTAGSGAVFQVQLWLMEGSHAVQVKYGSLTADGGPGWESLSWGIKADAGPGFMGLGRDGELAVCNPKVAAGGLPVCGPQHFPESSVLQYGLTPGIDLAGRVERTSLTMLSSSIQLGVATTLLNVGDVVAAGVGFELSLVEVLGPGPGPGSGAEVTVFSHPGTESVQSASALVIENLVVAPRPANGAYWLCASIDPGADLLEQDRSNNVVCARESVTIGPDLIVSSITAPLDGEPGGTVSVPFSIENIGTSDAGAFNYRLLLKRSAEDAGVTLLTGRIDGGLAAGATLDRTESPKLPAIIREDNYFFEVWLDVDREVDESNRSNNSGISATGMINRRPELKITRPIGNLSLVDGCYFGEALTATFEICNEGSAKAVNFHPSVIMGNGFQVAVLEDVPAASFPQFCGVPETKNHTACEPIAGRSASCAAEFCRLECSTDADCGSTGMRCSEDAALSASLGREAKGCMNHLAPGDAAPSERCKTFSISGRIPVEDRYGIPHTEGTKRFHVVDGGWHSLSQHDEDSIIVAEVLCKPALLDLAVAGIDAPTTVVAGKAAAISHAIQNLGFINPGPDGSAGGQRESFTYRFYLSLTQDLGTHQIPVAVQATGGEGVKEIGRRETIQGTDVVMIPPDVQPGRYHLSLMLDPENELVEETKSNNVAVFSQMITVEPKALQILTKELPRANLGAQYSHTFVASLGTGSYSWSAENLPPGMSMNEQGLFHGRPAALGSFVFTVRVQAADEVSERLIALQVLPGQSTLEVATETLPIAAKGARYGSWYDRAAERYEEGVRLAASGGQPPYRWSLDPSSPESRLPAGLEGPDIDGVIRGQATLRSESGRFSVLVEDALGNVARRWLEIVVVDARSLLVSSQGLPLATSGMDYHGCALAQGGDGVYQWSVEPASLPRGLTTAVSGSGVCLEGVPTECGSFTVRLQVRDGAGESAAAALRLEVECGFIQLSARSVRPVSRGEEIEFRLLATPSESPTFSLFQGQLPGGLSLSADGMISGTVSGDAAFGSYDLIIELRDVQGRRSLSAMTMNVNVEPSALKVVKTKETTGCSSAGGSSGSGAALWLVVLCLVAKRITVPRKRIHDV